MSSGTAGPSLLDVLRERESDGLCRYVHYEPGTGDSRELTGPELARSSLAVGCALRHVERSAGETTTSGFVPLIIRDPLSFIVGFFAVMQAGLVPVPAPSRPDSHRGHLQRLRTIVDASAPLAILVDTLDEAILPDLPCPILQLDDVGRVGEGSAPPWPRPRAVAYVQYTSGSIADPKPIALGHENVLAQLAQAAEGYGEGPHCVSVNWVPLYHDMGLVTSVLRPLYSGYTSVLLDPFDFVCEPSRWPAAMSEWEASHTSAPDFGYELCVRKTTDAGRFDLRPLRVARSAGEPVRPRTLRAFAEKFRPAGFDYAAFKPSYGLAEATLTVTTCPLTEPPRSLRLSVSELRQGRVLPSADAAESTEIVSCGRPLRDTRVEIVDPATRSVLDPGRLGEVWISGPQVAPSNDDAHMIEGSRGHCTGDMGFWHEGELFLIGRGKERFQVAGENYYSGELEALAGTADARLRPGRAAVFLGRLERWPDPVPVVLAECRAADGLVDGDGALVAKSVVSAIGRATGLPVHGVWLVSAGSLPVTTSGKIQRERCRRAFETGAIDAVYRYEREPK